MVKNHLKRLNVPNSWAIKKKSNVFVTRPMSGGHVLDNCISLNVALRDLLKVGKTSKEIKHILYNNDILVNGKRRTDIKFAVGFMDLLEIKSLKETYRFLLNHKGKLTPIKVQATENNLLLLKVKDKTLIKGGKLQVNFTDGSNLLVEKDDSKVNDVVAYDMQKKTMQTLKLEKGSQIFVTGGRYVGRIVTLESIKDKEMVFKLNDGDVFRTSLDYAFVVGKDKPLITIIESKK
jgi:small subunit ribosomal protein S4e